MVPPALTPIADAVVLSDRSEALVVDADTDLAAQHPHRFATVVVLAATWERASAGHVRATVHHAVQHLLPSGRILFDNPPAEIEQMLSDFDLERVGIGSSNGSSVYRRSDRTNVHDLVFEARRLIGRVTPLALFELLVCSDPPLVLDTRTPTDRTREGVIPGSIHAPRTVLEWHLDPANGYRHPAVSSFEQALVVVCNGGYSSSLAAANLVRMGFTNACDLIGGHRAWRAAGLPVAPPDHSHLDI